MRDSEVVASITAGDPLGLAAAYDRYSGPLFGYCQTLLDEPADAADAVQDTFVIAASKLTTLRDPERLRAWLFAVARNECLHRMKSRQAAAPLTVAADRPDDSADVSAEAERAEARALIRAAAGGLNAGERDVINQLWRGLEVREVAAVLGVSRNHAYSLFSRALDQLETSVGVLLVGRAGRKDCAALDRLLTGWDGRLTAPLRKRVGRHIDSCQVCSDRRRQVLTPALLYDLTPAAILALAVAHHPWPPAPAGHPAPGAHLAALPDGSRGEVLRLASGHGPHAAAYRAAVTRSTGPFRGIGLPRAAHPGHLALARVAHLPHAIAGGSVATATATAAMTATAVVAAIVPHMHVPSVPGGRTASAPTAVHAPSAGLSPVPGTAPAGIPTIGLTARSVPTGAVGKAKPRSRKAKAADPRSGKHTGAGNGHGPGGQNRGDRARGPGQGGEDGKSSGSAHGNSQGNQGSGNQGSGNQGHSNGGRQGHWHHNGQAGDNGAGPGHSHRDLTGHGNWNSTGNGNGNGNVTANRHGNSANANDRGNCDSTADGRGGSSGLASRPPTALVSLSLALTANGGWPMAGRWHPHHHAGAAPGR